MSEHGQNTLEDFIGWNKSLHLKIIKLEQDKTNLAESCIKLKETARLDRIASLAELAKMSKQVEGLYADKIEFDKLKEGIRNLKTYVLQIDIYGKDKYMERRYDFGTRGGGDYVKTEDLEKLLKGDN